MSSLLRRTASFLGLDESGAETTTTTVQEGEQRTLEVPKSTDEKKSKKHHKHKHKHRHRDGEASSSQQPQPDAAQQQQQSALFGLFPRSSLPLHLPAGLATATSGDKAAPTSPRGDNGEQSADARPLGGDGDGDSKALRSRVKRASKWRALRASHTGLLGLIAGDSNTAADDAAAPVDSGPQGAGEQSLRDRERRMAEREAQMDAAQRQVQSEFAKQLQEYAADREALRREQQALATERQRLQTERDAELAQLALQQEALRHRELALCSAAASASAASPSGGKQIKLETLSELLARARRIHEELRHQAHSLSEREQALSKQEAAFKSAMGDEAAVRSSRTKIEGLRDQLQQLRKDNERLRKDNERLHGEALQQQIAVDQQAVLAAMDNQRRALETLNAELEQRAQAVADSEAALAARSKTVEQQQLHAEQQHTKVQQLQAVAERRAHDVQQREQAAAEQQAAVDARAAQLAEREHSLQVQTAQFKELIHALKRKEDYLKAKEAKLKKTAGQDDAQQQHDKELERLAAESELFQQQLVALQDAHRQLEQQYVQLQDAHRQLEQQHTQLQDAHRQLEQQRAQLQDANQQLEQQHRQLQDANQQLEQQHASDTAQLASIAAERDQLAATVQSLQAQLQDAQRPLPIVVTPAAQQRTADVEAAPSGRRKLAPAVLKASHSMDVAADAKKAGQAPSSAVPKPAAGGAPLFDLRSESQPVLKNFVQEQPASVDIPGVVLKLPLDGSGEARAVTRLPGHTIDSFAAGAGHAVLLLADHSLWVKGSDDEGQLFGQGARSHWTNANQLFPKSVGQLVAVACGDAFCAAVTEKGKVYTWGANASGQCGQRGSGAAPQAKLTQPKVVVGLLDRLIVQVACGSAHMLVRSNVGEVYSWGDGQHGALGHGSTDSAAAPKRVARLRNAPVVQLACGRHHSAALCTSGTVFVWGRAGSPSAALLLQPTPVAELLHLVVIELLCVGHATVCRCADGQLWLLGRLDGSAAPQDSNRARPIAKSLWPVHAMAGNATRLFVLSDNKVFEVRDSDDAVELGGLAAAATAAGQPYSASLFAGHATLYACYTSSGEFAAARHWRGHRDVDVDPLTCPAVQRGYMRASRPLPLLDLSTARQLEREQLLVVVELVFSKPRLLNGSFLRADHVPDEALGSVNFAMLKETLRLMSMRFDGVVEAVLRGLRSCVSALSRTFVYDDSVTQEELRVWLVLTALPFLAAPDQARRQVLEAACNAFGTLPARHRQLLQRLWSSMDRDDFAQLVAFFQNALSMTLPLGTEVQPITYLILNVLRDLCQLNDASFPRLVPPSAFANRDVSEREIQRMARSWQQWKASVGPAGRSFLNWPFVLNSRCKLACLDRYLRDGRGDEAAQKIVVEVDREQLLDSAVPQLDALHSHHIAIRFRGEQGIDEGGLSKEFFQLAVEALAAQGLFYAASKESSGLSWFAALPGDSDSSAQRLHLYSVAGMLCGLAIFARVVLPLSFPEFMWARILHPDSDADWRPSLADLRELDPVLSNSLHLLLGSPPDTVDDLGLSFVCRDAELKPGGARLPVTAANRHEYVELYLDVLLRAGVARQFDAFQRGFLQVCGHAALGLFSPTQLSELVSGSATQELNFKELEESTVYTGGYSSSHETVKAFWRTVHRMDARTKRLLLAFVTGSDREPVGGLASMRWIVQRSEMPVVTLPSASTCYNTLHLPDYHDEALLYEKLLLAIENCRGFGLG